MRTFLFSFLLLMLLVALREVTVADDHATLPLPGEGSGPAAISAEHFPSRMHAFVWRNWSLVDKERLAKVLRTSTDNVEKVATSMGLSAQKKISPYWGSSRGYITVLKRNWHLIPYEQLLEILDTDREKLAYSLREDDFLFVKLGMIKPTCEPLYYTEPTDEQNRKAAKIAGWMQEELGADWCEQPEEPRFAFIETLSQTETVSQMGQAGINGQNDKRNDKRNTNDERVTNDKRNINGERDTNDSAFELRFIYSYFATFGDPLLDPTVDSYPDGLLQKLAASGVNGIWLHTALRTLVPPSETFPEFGDKHEIRLQSLRTLVDRAKKHGIGVYLYVNEPRAMHESFFASEERKKMIGVREGDHCALCTSCPEVRQWLTDSMQHVFESVPDLAGVFTITGSENLTNCASHYQQGQCERCKNRSFADIIAEVNTAIEAGVKRGNPNAKVIVWDWGWQDLFVEEIINRLPKSCWFMSVSEWSLPIERGGVKTTVGEYSISAVGPGPRATKHWEYARKAGLKTVAKVQVNATWEMSAVPYIPALELVAQHGNNLSQQQVNGLMLSWSVGGYPSANLDLFRRFSQQKPIDAANALSADQKNDSNAKNQNDVTNDVLRQVAASHFGNDYAQTIVDEAWRKASESFREFPYHGSSLYQGPQQLGPANLLYLKPTGYKASMVGFPYDDVNGWRSVYPGDVYAGQMRKTAAGFGEAAACFRRLADKVKSTLPELHQKFAAEARIADTVRIHFQSVANQTDYVLHRNAVQQSDDASHQKNIDAMRNVVQNEIRLAKEFFPIVNADSRIGYEASNHYYYVPADLAEKIINCRFLLEQLQ